MGHVVLISLHDAIRASKTSVIQLPSLPFVSSFLTPTHQPCNVSSPCRPGNGQLKKKKKFYFAEQLKITKQSTIKQ